MNIITLNAEKGGVGKTTLAVHVAAGLAIRGQTVLLVDADPQGHATMSMGLKKSPGLYNLMVRPEDYSILDVIRPIAPVVYSSDGARGRLFVLPGNNETRSITDQVDDSAALRDQLMTLEGVDTVIIDTPPTPGNIMALVYRATEYVIVPTQAEALSIEGMMNTINRAQKEGAQLLGIVPNLLRKTALHTLNYQHLKQAARERGWALWQPIAEATAWGESSQAKRTVFSLLPQSRAAGYAWGLVDAVEGALGYA